MHVLVAVKGVEREGREGGMEVREREGGMEVRERGWNGGERKREE